MANPMSSKEAAATLIDPFNEPEPSADTGLNTHFGSTFAGASNPGTSASTTSPSSKNPYRHSPSGSKGGITETTRPIGRSSPPSAFPAYRDEAARRSSGEHRSRRSVDAHGPPPPAYDAVAGSSSAGEPSRRRGSSLRERYPGDNSHKPLDIIRRDSKKAHRSPHLRKQHLPGPDTVDRLDPALGGRAYHHEGPFDAALLARNTDPKYAPVAALETTNQEALNATAPENVKDAVERHQPLDGVAVVPPGQPDRLGRTLNYEEGTDMMREGFNSEPGYKRWPGKDYDKEDLKGESEPSFSLDRALKAHRIDDNGIEMSDQSLLNKDYHKKERDGSLDNRDPVHIAGDDGKYVDLQHANDTDLHKDVKRTGSLRHAGDSLKKRIGSLRKKNHDD